MAVIAWEWTGEGSIEGQIEIEKILPEDSTTFAGGYDYEETEPSETFTFTARGLAWSEVNSLRATAKLRLHLWEITDTDGNDWEGLRQSFSWKKIIGTTRFEVTLTLIAPSTVPS